jgi:hypothetical protein
MQRILTGSNFLSNPSRFDRSFGGIHAFSFKNFDKIALPYRRPGEALTPTKGASPLLAGRIDVRNLSYEDLILKI